MLFFSQSFKLMVCWGKACYHRLLGESMCKMSSQYFLLQGIRYYVKYRLELCCGIIFSRKKKIRQKFWMQSKKEDRQVILLEEAVRARLVPGGIPALCSCSFCWAQVLNWSTCVERWPDPLASGTTETTLSHRAMDQNPDLFRSNKQKEAKVRWMNSFTRIKVLGNIFPSVVCLNFGGSSRGFSFHLICPCESRV